MKGLQLFPSSQLLCLSPHRPLMSQTTSQAADEAPGAEPSSVGPDTPKGQPGDELTAALLMVGDELLAGKVADTNATYLCKELRAIGWVHAVLVGRHESDISHGAVRSLEGRR